jgi:iron uptake system EfeUOB component EfeO/EfeM
MTSFRLAATAARLAATAARLAATAAVCCVLAACSGSSSVPVSTEAAPGIAITVSPHLCGSGWHHPSTGLLTFQIRNTSTTPVDVSLLNAVTGGVYAEIDSLAPGTTRPMQVDVGSGQYVFQCDGDTYGQQTGPTADVPGNVPDSQAVIPATVAQTLAAITSDKTYIERGLATVAGQTTELARDIDADNIPAARDAWLTAHLSFERLGSAYGMFGDFDDEIDGTPDGLPGGVNGPSFTGFYRIEYGLWHGQSAAELSGPAQQLDKDVRALQTAYPGMVLYPQAALSDLALRTHEILEHAIRFQLSGADDFGSGTTLATADANIDATKAQLGMLQPLLVTRYPGDLSSVYAWLNQLQRLIEAQHTGGGWTPVSKLTASQREDIDSAAAETVQLLAPIAVMFESSPLS